MARSGRCCQGIASALALSGLLVTLTQAPGSAFAATTVPWTVLPTAALASATGAALNGVSCVTSTCVAVGSVQEASGMSTLAEEWTGTNWVLLTTVAPTGATSSQLNAISCTSSTACIAVGQSTAASGTEQTLAESWDGSRWAIQPTPNPTGATHSVLYSVSCNNAGGSGLTSTVCSAVGSTTGSNGIEGALAEAWNGTKWALQSARHRVATTNGALLGVSCLSTTSCTAVGTDTNSSGEHTLVESWNGTNWSIQPSPNEPKGQGSALFSVACLGTSSCIAAGLYVSTSVIHQADALAEAWNGTKWTLQPTPPNKQGFNGSTFFGLSCVQTSVTCEAVGTNAQNAVNATLAESVSGGVWRLQGMPGFASSDLPRLLSVSCVSSTACMAVGDVLQGSSESPLAEKYS